jgi:hypothetical protein
VVVTLELAKVQLGDVRRARRQLVGMDEHFRNAPSWFRPSPNFTSPTVKKPLTSRFGAPTRPG